MNAIQQIYNDTEIFFKTSPRQREIFRHGKNKPLAFDTETTGLDFGVPSQFFVSDKCQIEVANPTAFGISVCLLYEEELKLFWGRAGTSLFDGLVELLNQPRLKIAHNARYDIRVLRGQGLILPGPFRCTLIMSRIINDNRMKHSLQSLVEVICPGMSDWEIEVKATLKNIKSRYTRAGYPKGYANYSFIPEEIIRKYACIDVFMTYILNMKYYPIIMRVHKEVYSREIKVMKEAIHVENKGLLFNRRRAKKEVKRLNKRSELFIESIQKYLGKSCNPESYKQLLEGMLKYGFKAKELIYKGKPSTCKEVLERVEVKTTNKNHIKVAHLLLNLRSARTLASRYLIPLTKRASYNHGIVYCSINSADTKTGRMTISSPSLQNIPRPDSGAEDTNEVRACFGPRAGHTWYLFDYSQMEMVYFCLLAGAWKMVEAYMAGADVHIEMTRRVLGKKAFHKDGAVIKAKRDEIKHLSFAILYGMGIRAIAEKLKVNITKADQVMAMYLSRIPEIVAFRNECDDLVDKQGYVDCMFDKRYSADRTNAYKMVNKRVQGGCAQILKIGILQVSGVLSRHDRFRAAHVLPIHDELIFERRNDAPVDENMFVSTVKNAMEQIPQLMKLGLKMRVDVSKTTTNWANKEKILT